MACHSQLAREFIPTLGLSSGFPRCSYCFSALDLSQRNFICVSFRQGRHDGQTKSRCIFVDLIHLTSCELRRNLRTSLDVCCLVFLLPGFLFTGGVMAKCTVLPYPRSKRKTNSPTAETQECGFYESAFLADRGCFAFMHQRRKPRNARPDQRKRA